MFRLMHLILFYVCVIILSCVLTVQPAPVQELGWDETQLGETTAIVRWKAPYFLKLIKYEANCTEADDSGMPLEGAVTKVCSKNRLFG